MEEQYEVLNVNLGGLTRYQVNSYEEISVINTCDEDIILVDNNNNQIIIPSTNIGVARKCLTIYKRATIGATISSTGHHVEMPGIKIEIDKYRLRNEPVYVKEIDKLVCTADQAVAARHPFSKVTYEEGLELTIDKLSQIIDNAPSVKLLANDPTNTYDQIYTYLDNAVVSIPVTHYSGDGFQLIILVVRSGKYYKECIDLSVFLQGTDNEIEFQNKFIPWVTTSEYLAIDLAKSFKWITPTMYNDMKSKLTKEYKDKLALAIDEKQAEMDTLQLELTKMRNENEALMQDRDEYKYKYTSLRADKQSWRDSANDEMAYAKLRNDLDISDNKVRLTRIQNKQANTESEFKLWHLALAAALPVVAVGGMKVFDYYMKN